MRAAQLWLQRSLYLFAIAQGVACVPPSPSRGGQGWGWGRSAIVKTHPPPNLPLERGGDLKKSLSCFIVPACGDGGCYSLPFKGRVRVGMGLFMIVIAADYTRTQTHPPPNPGAEGCFKKGVKHFAPNVYEPVSGRVMVTSKPPPAALVAVMLPPWRRTARSAMARPMPVPPLCRSRASATR